MKTLNDCIIPDEKDVNSLIAWINASYGEPKYNADNEVLKQIITTILRGNMCKAISDYIEYSKQDDII